MERGKVVRSAVDEVPAKGRDTMGVVFAKPDEGDRIIAVARNSERSLGADADDVSSPATDDDPAGAVADTPVGSAVPVAVPTKPEETEPVSPDESDANRD